MNLKTSILSALALIAFAGNSVLCRLALNDGLIHPSSFTSVRLVSGALVLWLLVWASNIRQEGRPLKLKAGWAGPTMLFAYAALFSFAYITLDTGVGALILFGSVQITMVIVSLFRGNRLSMAEGVGLMLACAGLAYLVFPELSKPSLSGFIMMSLAGIAWGFYTVLGQGSENPLAETAANFIKSIPFAFVMLLPFLDQMSDTPFDDGATLKVWVMAAASGAITSGIGYAIWYSALRELTASLAGVLQLLVPIIAALGGVFFANELLTQRLVLASLMTLGGIFIVITAKNRVG